jgi:hypothetical protein
MKHIQQPKIHRKIHTSKKISRKKSVNQKSWDFCQMFVISIYSLAYGFLFVMIFISGEGGNEEGEEENTGAAQEN